MCLKIDFQYFLIDIETTDEELCNKVSSLNKNNEKFYQL